MSILRRMLDWLGLYTKPDSRSYEVSESFQVTLTTLAKYEGRSEQDLLPDLLAAGLDRYLSNDKYLSIWESLTQREQQIAALTCLGMTNRQIAARLSLAPDTVKTHMRSVLKKFGLNSKGQLRHILREWDFSGW